MRGSSVLAVLAGVTVLVAGCADPDAVRTGSVGSSLPTVTPTATPVATPTADPPGKAALVAAAALWKTKAPASYHFTYQPECFCSLTKIVVTVADGAVKSVVKAPKQDRSFGPDHVPTPAEALSIEQLFADLHRAYDGPKPAAKVEVTYDAVYGFPKTAYIDWIEHGADEEDRYTVSEFTPAPPVDVVGKWLPERDNGAFITFNADGTYVGSDGCNGISGNWSTASGRLVITTGEQTLIGCDNQAVNAWIAAADSVAVSGDSMTIVKDATTQVLTRRG